MPLEKIAADFTAAKVRHPVTGLAIYCGAIACHTGLESNELLDTY
jgi:hypothetical protein